MYSPNTFGEYIRHTPPNVQVKKRFQVLNLRQFCIILMQNIVIFIHAKLDCSPLFSARCWIGWAKSLRSWPAD
jgi:hypothetical protein